ncbi:DUF6942 family protein [Paraglaciecola marina]|uniref:DUF6942 family protein n=1 Tax=Paraglaciecola marina TaxID=2500157 RepID=UPI00105DFF26|nr:hypothetical protein [Paraglaciecola marina]
MMDTGLGDINTQFKVYIANRPNFADFQDTQKVTPLGGGELDAIGKTCGNGWRKVFNVYAKVLFALNCERLVSVHKAATWQEFRDKYLLQAASNTSLLFTPPELSNDDIHIVMGKTYAKSLGLSLEWINDDFAIAPKAKLIVCPYFDYRQLSNIKIVTLVELIRQQSGNHNKTTKHL